MLDEFSAARSMVLTGIDITDLTQLERELPTPAKSWPQSQPWARATRRARLGRGGSPAATTAFQIGR